MARGVSFYDSEHRGSTIRMVVFWKAFQKDDGFWLVSFEDRPFELLSGLIVDDDNHILTPPQQADIFCFLASSAQPWDRDFRAEVAQRLGEMNTVAWDSLEN